MTAKVALVTGGIGGIGTAICRRLAKDGLLVIAAHHPGEAEQAAKWCDDQAGDGLDIKMLAVDVSSYEECAEKLSALVAEHGSVDVVVNCAGITRDKTFKKMEKEHWYDVINVNLNSIFNRIIKDFEHNKRSFWSI